MVTGSPTVSGRTPGGIPFPGPVPPRAIRMSLSCARYGKHTVTRWSGPSRPTRHKHYGG
ncbi:hypothetical protein Ppa06_42660 [Planomonospora parontospora subsp. parontospora]|uniref:Uncharacterized protein n=2 Tax=Planomonospora parontospora TaxID=58119 RepID=A0AA37F6P3_9ACTN|nr:hypothetical protein GCM10010126_48510 [Planomonospora parontospora]GII10468.1 hypothetical protein Ppa06_42660 [Planomonospora parontospora subsp. parontospora]